MAAINSNIFGEWFFEKEKNQITNTTTNQTFICENLNKLMPKDIEKDYYGFCDSIKAIALNVASLGDAPNARSIAKIILCFNSKIPCWADECREAILKKTKDIFLRNIAMELLKRNDVNFSDIHETLNEIEYKIIKNSAYALIACQLNQINLELAKKYGDEIKNDEYKVGFNLSRLIEISRNQLPQEQFEKKDFPPEFSNSPNYTDEVQQLIAAQKFDEAHKKVDEYFLDRFESDEIL